MNQQTEMTGDDWTSDRDRKARKKAAIACAKKLEAAADALSAFSMACLECEDGSSPKRADDSRTLLAASCREYSGYLDDVYGSDRGDAL